MLVAGHDVAGRHHIACTINIGAEATRLAHQHDTGANVPRLEATLPEPVETACRHPGEVKRRRACPADTCGLGLHLRKLTAKLHCIPPAPVRNTARDDSVMNVTTPGDADAPVVEVGPTTALGCKQLIGDRVVHHARHRLAIAGQPDGHGKVRNTVNEIRGTINRINHPNVLPVLAGDLTRLFQHEAPLRTRLLQLLADHLFSLAVSTGDEVRRCLLRHLQVLHLAEVARNSARCLAGSVDHDGNKG